MNISEHNMDGVVFYAADAFDQAGGVFHGFSTRYGGVSSGQFSSLNLGHTRGDNPAAVRENYRRFCAATGAAQRGQRLDRLVLSKQVHQDNVRVVTLADAGKGLDQERDYETDGLVTDIPGLPLVIFSADCIPVLFYDPVRRVVGACHCGWRGTAMGMAAKTARTLCSVYGSRPEDILAAIGPGISRCCFETHTDVPDAMTDALGEAAQPYIDVLPNGKFRVDLKGLNALFLRQAGLKPEHISVCDQCTCCQPEKFWTHRLVGNARGSLAAIIELSPDP